MRKNTHSIYNKKQKNTERNGSNTWTDDAELNVYVKSLSELR